MAVFKEQVPSESKNTYKVRLGNWQQFFEGKFTVRYYDDFLAVVQFTAVDPSSGREWSIYPFILKRAAKSTPEVNGCELLGYSPSFGKFAVFDVDDQDVFMQPLQKFAVGYSRCTNPEGTSILILCWSLFPVLHLTGFLLLPFIFSLCSDMHRVTNKPHATEICQGYLQDLLRQLQPEFYKKFRKDMKNSTGWEPPAFDAMIQCTEVRMLVENQMHAVFHNVLLKLTRFIFCVVGVVACPTGAEGRRLLRA